MSRDRLIQLVSVIIIIISLALTLIIAPTIKNQRRELNISGTVNRADLPPQYVLATSALGSFRGIAIDALWYRANHLKNIGQFYEANTLADWITTLQPRFPQVWVFQSWNMAYNISVETNTPQERWHWVKRGIDLLRNRGLVYNPQSVTLYRELGWFFMHKIGMSSDDMHWYYKRELATKWQKLLGAPTQGADTKQVLARFEPIADMAEKYFRFNQPTRATQNKLKSLIQKYPPLKHSLEMMKSLSPDNLAKLIKKKLVIWQQPHPEIIKPLEKLLKKVEAHVAISKVPAISTFLKDYPNAKPIVSKLRSWGLKMDQQTLLRIGDIHMLIRYTPASVIKSQAKSALSDINYKLLQLSQDPISHGGLLETLNFLRAKVLYHDYNMDPVFMYELMQEYGPIDWRHPDAQSLYWYALGVHRGQGFQGNPNFDLLNTGRGVIHSLQGLMHQGKIIFNPRTQRIDMLPDTRFVASYAKAMYGTEKRAKARGLGEMSSFKTGYQHFLEHAIMICYLYGDTNQAQKYYKTLRQKFSNINYNKTSGTYNLPIDQFVMVMMQRDLGQRFLSRGFIGAMLTQGFMQGLANGRPNVYQHFQNVALQGYKTYQKQYNNTTKNAYQNRQGLPPFSTIVINTYVNLIRNPNISLLERSRIYYNSPAKLRQLSYPRFITDVTKQAKLQKIDVNKAFPAPKGLDKDKIKPKKPQHHTTTE